MKIRIRYIIFFILVIIYVPLGISLHFTYIDSLSEVREQFELSHSNLLNGIKLNISSEIEKIKLLLISLSQHKEVKRKNTPYCDKLFAQLKNDCNYCLNILLADEKGNNIGSAINPEEAHKLNYLDKEWFHNGFKEEFYINPPHISKLFKKKTFMVTYPVFEQGRQIAVLGIPVDLDKIGDIISKTYTISEKTNIVIVNEKGILVYNLLFPDFVGGPVKTKAVNDLIFSGKRGSKEIVGVDGLKRIFIFDTIDGLGWKVFVSIPPTELYSESFRRVQKQLYVATIVFIVSLILTLIFTRRFSRNTETLLSSFRDLSSGKREIKSFPMTNCHEFNEIFRALNDTTKSLISYESELENLSRAYQLLSEINQKIVRYDDIDLLFKEICKDIVEIGVYDFALIGEYEISKEDQSIKVKGFHSSDKVKDELNLYNFSDGKLNSKFLFNLTKEKSFLIKDRCYLTDDTEGLDLLTFYSNIYTANSLYGLIIIGKKEKTSFIDRETVLLQEIVKDIGFAVSTFLTKREKEKTEWLLNSIFTNMGEGLIVVDRDKKIIMANKKYFEIVKKDPKDVIGMHCYECFFDFNKPCTEFNKECMLDLIFEDGKSKNIYYQLKEADGSERTYLVRYDPLYEDGEIKYFIIIYSDLTDYKKLELQYLHAQKMESVGRLSAGIAHDFNNILTGIMGSATLAMMSDINSKVKNYLDTIIELTDKAANLTKSLLTFSRKQSSNPELININEVLLKTEKILRRVIGENITIKLNLTAKPLYVYIDPSQLEQVVMNLAVNARDAISGDNGFFSISTELVEITESFKKNYGFGREGSYALISFTDNGCGIPQDIMDKIFDPFFTTKGVGKGTGLGLSVVYGIVKSFDGFIKVYSEVGKGTTFKIYFPIIREKVEDIRKDDNFVNPSKLDISVLLVEDDRNVLEVLKGILENLVAKVETAEDGESALNILKDKDFDLVITDIIMPKLSGVDLFNKVKELNKNVEFIFTSGYPYDLIDEKFFIDKDKLLQKPITPEKLYNKILSTIRK